MIRVLREWYERHFTDPQVVLLALLLLAGFAVVVVAGNTLAPVLAAIVIAYLLDGSVEFLRRLRIPRFAAVVIVFSVFLAMLLLVLLGLIPLLSQQVTQFFRELPNMLAAGQELLMRLPEHYPQFITEKQVQELINGIRVELAAFGQRVLSISLSSVPGLIALLVYVILVPLLVFFFLKDKMLIIRWFQGFLPKERGLADEVWMEVNSKIASYVRGKFLEILIVWSVSYLTFMFFGLQYAILLSFLVGVSVIIPYVGAAVATIPIAFIAYFQWGTSQELVWVLIAYLVIQFLDGNLLVPLLFSEVVNLHPVAIIVAVLIFGALWGLWGVFFAIPLATLVHAVLNAWPHKPRPGEGTADQAPHDESVPA